MQDGELGGDVGAQFDALPAAWERKAVLCLRRENIDDE